MDIILYCFLLVPCITLVPLSLSFNSVAEKFKSYLGIQYGTFLLRKKKFVLLYVRRVILVPFSEKKLHPFLCQVCRCMSLDYLSLCLACTNFLRPSSSFVSDGFVCFPAPFPYKKWQRAAAELFGRRQQGGGNGNVRVLAAAHPWTLVAVVAAAAAAVAGGGQRRLLCSAFIEVGPLMHRLALRARSPGRQGGSSGACFTWLASGLGR